MEKIGLDGKTYRNTGTWGTPVWSEFDVLKEPAFGTEKADITVQNRKRLSNRHKGGRREDSLELTISWDAADANFQAILDAYFADPATLVDIAVADGDIATSGTEYFRGELEVLSFSKGEPIDGEMTATASLKPGLSDNNPDWFTVA